jgi:hypothetical protein
MTPTFQLLVSGNDITADVSKRGAVIEWSDAVDESSDALTITLQDTDNLLSVPKSGAKIELSAGYNGQLQRVGSYTVESTELSGPPDILTVSATAAPIAQAGSIAARSSKSWEDTTLGDIAKSISAKLKSALAIDSALAGVQIVNQQQVDESDTNFLLRLVRRHGGFLKFTDSRLVIAQEGAGVGAGGAALGITLTRSEITRWRVSAGGKGQAFAKVKVKYHDYETGETNEVEAEVEKSSSLSELTKDASWLEVSESAFTPPALAADADQAKAQAKTTAKRLARSSRSFELTLPGRLDIVAGGKVTLSGFREGVNGAWLVKSIRHRLDSSGWSMTVDGEGA